MRKLVVNENEAGQRLDKLLTKYLNKSSKGFIYKMLRKKNITVNGKKTDGARMLAAGDEITLFLSEETIAKFREDKLPSLPAGGKRRLKLERDWILYEDDHILLINKPSGLLSQKGQEGDVSLVELLMDYLLDNGTLSQEDLRSFRPAVCNRLDRNTSGIVIAGKSLPGLQEMSRMLKERTIRKEYLTIVKGRLLSRQKIHGYLWKDETLNKVSVHDQPVPGGQWIETGYEPLLVSPDYTLLKVALLTGRTHQIRSHLAAIGHPVGGDGKYGDQAANGYLKQRYGVTSQLLHSAYLTFPEITGQLAYLSGKQFQAPLPKAFQAVMRGEGLSSEEEA